MRNLKTILPLVIMLSGLCTAAEPLSFRVVENEQRMKGGSLQPQRSPKYVLRAVKAVLNDSDPKLSEEAIEATLRKLLSYVRDDSKTRGLQLDGVTAFLFRSMDHVEGGNAPLGLAEWWPKGHSFDPENKVNIQDKTSYVETTEVFSLPRSAGSQISRLPKATRRTIFEAMVRSEDRATREAETKFPTDASKIPYEKLRSYDWTSAFAKNSEENDRLNEKYKLELLQKYKISASELEAISKEAFAEQWPLPSHD